MEKTAVHYQEVSFYRNPSRPDGKGNIVTTFDKLKVNRPVVKITDAEAKTLNGSALSDPNNTHIVYYLKPGEKLPDLVTPLK